MEQKNNELNYFLEPGSIFACWKPYCLATVLGSGVSVCLYDPNSKIAGMNNFIYPKQFGKQGFSKFGSLSIPHLLKMMVNMGADERNIQAHIIGGSVSTEHSSIKIGKKNVEVAVKLLKQNKIPIVNNDTGGFFGRKVMFNTNNGEIVVYKSMNIREKDWYADKSINYR